MGMLTQLTNPIRPYMKAHGYQYAKNCFYQIRNDIAYCIQLDMPGGLIYVTFYVMPLYIPCENRYYTYGNRVNALRHSKSAPLRKDALESEITKWREQLYDCLETFVFPFFQRISTPQKLIQAIEGKRDPSGPYFACPEVQIDRLRLFSYLYTGEFEKISGLIQQYRQVIRNSTFLSEGVRNLYLQEMETVEQLIAAGVPQSRDFCAKTIEASLRKCFP